MLKVEGLTVGYDKTVIIREMDAVFPANKVTAIIGPNGCGKSTLLKTMARLQKQMSGTVYLNGQAIHKMPTGEIARKMAILPQGPEAPEGLSVRDLVGYGRTPYLSGFSRLSRRDKEMIDWAMEMTGLAEFADYPVDALSGGQRQRAWIAMSIAQETDLLLLDEPTTYLDLAHQLEVLQLLEALNREQGCTVVMVIHDLNHAARYADHLVAMKQGRIIQTGAAEEVVNPAILQEVFQIDATIVQDPRTGKPALLSYDLNKF
ncbi:MAG: ABC transporter ATP-binding protein [Bacillus sp. (in: firmicutes)]